MSTKTFRSSAALLFMVTMLVGLPVREERTGPSLLDRLERALPASVRALLDPAPAQPDRRPEAQRKCGPGIDPNGKPCP
jgi:hypothetical protein